MPAVPHSPEPRLELRGITKRYPAALANDGISLSIPAGGVHALLGENGAGKSTLVKIVYGVVAPDEGEILWEGRPIAIRSPAHARALGIGMVFQHFNLFETLTIAENISLGLDDPPEPRRLMARVRELSARYGLPVDPRRYAHDLSVAERQRVEIVRCLLQEPKLLIMDEPTSVLTPQETERLFETLRTLGREGCSILYISHKLEEIRGLCDDATVLRAGRVVATCDPRKETAAGLARMMIGADIPAPERKRAPEPGPERLRLSKLSLASSDPFGTNLKDVDLSLRAGEIVGIAGVTGNGQRELLRALSGEIPVRPRGAIAIDGRPAGHLGPVKRRAMGLGFVPEERLGRGAVPDMTLAENALLTAARKGLVEQGLIRPGAMTRFADEVRRRFDVRAAGSAALARNLSGGNLQKFIVGREITQQPEVLVLAYPTWGVDVGAATAIHRAITDLREAGAAILIVSEDLDELFALCDRIAVIASGRLSEPRDSAAVSAETLGLLMSGGPEEGASDHAPST